MFTNLHTHTDASLKDGLGTVQRLVSGVRKNGLYPALAMTDHGSLANAIAFILACKQEEVKPIVGLEAYVDVDGDIGHLTLLANGNEGFHNLITLNNIGHASKHRQPAFPLSDLLRLSNGIILLSGCQASPLQRMSLDEAVAVGLRLKMAFGSRFFIEAMAVNEFAHAERAIELAQKLKSKIIVTNDAHFPFESDAEIHSILTTMKAGYHYNSKELWLKPFDEMIRTFQKYCGKDLTKKLLDKGAFDRGTKLAEVIQEIELSGTTTIESLHASKMKELTSTIVKKLALTKKEMSKAEYKVNVVRLKAELAVIDKTGYADYFMALNDIVAFAKDSGVRVGPGRGSGAGSLVLYLLGITDVNPLTYDLSFERFLNQERIGMPDIDIDFDSELRQTVIDFAKEKFSAVPIATYSRYSHRSLIHDLCKTLKIPKEAESELAQMTVEDKNFKKFCEENETFGQCYFAFLDQIKHKGKHAGGVIITNNPVPIERAGEELVAAWTEGKVNELTYAGITKYDLLGLSALTCLRHLETKFGRLAPRPETTPLADKDKVFDLFQKGDLAGIFQFSGSDGIRDLCIALHPETFEDLVAINALYRPGTIDVGTAFKYPEWKKSPRKIHSLIDDILEETYGVIVFQEQVMKIVQRILGGTLAEADMARRVIVKTKPDDPKWVKSLKDLETKFIETGAPLLTRRVAKNLWNEISAHSRYSFNKAHAVSYAIIAWEMAWWKTFQRADFYAEMLNTDTNNAQLYMYEAIESGIEVKLPNINYSSHMYEVSDAIYMPLSSIKYLGLNAAVKIAEERKKNGLFLSNKDVMTRVPKSVLRANARLGLAAMHGFPDEVCEGLGIDELKIKEMKALSLNKKMKKFLGMIIPSKELLKKINEINVSGVYTAGIISEEEERASSYGPYRVYKLTPHGAFWTRKATLNIGDFIVCKIIRGKLVSIKSLIE